MRVVIVGVGEIGRELAENLARRQNNELVLIDLNKDRCKQIASELDALVLHGDGTDPDMLKKAQITESDALIATTGSDAINTVVAMLGQRIGVRRITVKLNDVGLRAACHEIGVSKIIAPKISAAAEIFSALYGFDRLDFSLVTRGGLQLVELAVGEARDQQISELNFPEGALLVAVLRGEQVLVPRGKTKLKQGDVLLTLVESEIILEQMKKILTPKNDSVRDQTEK